MRWRTFGAVLILGLLILGAGRAWRSHEVRQVRLARLLQEELHENRILRARQAALLGRAFELAQRVDDAAANLGGDVRATRSATEQIYGEAEAAGVAVPRPQPAAQLRAAL